MAIYFWDASALIKHYRRESGTEYVDRLLAEVGAEHFISRLGRVEILSTLTRLARTEEITQEDFQASYADAYEQGLLGRHLGIIAMTEAVYQTAERLFLDHGRHRRLRAPGINVFPVWRPWTF